MNAEKLAQLHGLKIDESEKLEGYASTNYRVKSGATNYLLKHYVDPDEYPLIVQEDAILQLLLKADLSVKVPYSIREMIVHEDRSFSRLLPFIEGGLLSTVEQSDELLLHFGAAVAKMNKALMNVNNDTIKARDLFWDMKHTLANAEKVSFINQPNDRKLVHYFLDLFEHLILPIQRSLRSGIIHSDLNDNNVLVADDKVTGLIDFGDIVYSPLIYEVAIAVTYIMLANEEVPFEKAQCFLKGYHSVLALQKEEIELLKVLIPSRLCVSVCNSAKKKAEGADTEYVLISERPAWALLHKWISINPLWIDDAFLNAVGLESEVLDIERLIQQRAVFTGKSLGTSYQEPIYMTGGAFQYMYDNLGNSYLDAYNNIPHIGHNHPNVSRAISSQVRKLNTNTRYLYPELTDYAEALQRKLPKSLSKTFFVNSGSAASDLAIRMARTHTKVDGIAILKNGYHGSTTSGISISDYKHSGKGGQGKPAFIVSLPLPKTYRGEYATGQEYASAAIEKLKTEIASGNKPAAFIAEPISGCGGQAPLAEGYLQTINPFLKANDILLIVDEVQTGFGRLGSFFWGFEMHGVVPDILILGKPMGNGHPVAAVVCTDKIAETFANGMEFFTSFGGNPVSCKVALEVLNTLEEEGLQENARVVGELLKTKLSQLLDDYECIGDVRGQGLFLGIEFVNSSGEPSEAMASFVKESLKQKFILVGTDGPNHNVIKIKPPLCFNAENAVFLAEEMEKSVLEGTKSIA